MPPIRKKVIYLDQFFFSHAFHGREPRFIEAAKRIRAVADQQLLAAPYSSIHETETLLYSGRDELEEFIKDASRGVEFSPSYRVKRTQIVRAFRAWLAGEPAGYVLKERDAIKGKLQEWEGYFRIDVGRIRNDPDDLRDRKQRAVDGLIDVFDSWRAGSESTFEQDLAAEYAAAATGLVDLYVDYVNRIGSGDVDAYLYAPVDSEIVASLMRGLPDQQSAPDRLRRCCEFLQSDHFKNTPRTLLSARLYASLRDLVKHGAYVNREKARKRISGIFFDIDHIATYAPYCDAIILDKAMAELVTHRGVELGKRFPLRVFSLNNWDELLAWLDEIEAGAGDEHKAALAAIHA